MKRVIRDLQSWLHDGTLQDIITAHLHAVSVLDDDEDVVALSVGEPDAEGKRPINLKIIKTKEVELIVHS